MSCDSAAKSKKPSGFVVSNIEKKAEFICGIPVYSISDIDLDESCGIIIAVNEQLTKEILSMIKKKNSNFSNIYQYRHI